MFETRAKIVCTIGPASDSPEMIEKMILAGMDVARLNFSHGTHEGHAKVVQYIRAASKKLGRPVAILQDLQGPKIRVGHFKNGPVNLVNGAKFTITKRDIDGDETIVSTTYKELPGDVKPGDMLLLDDGLIYLKVVQTDGTDVLTEVVNGGILKDHKGINLPGVNVSTPSLTEKDTEDLMFGLEQDVDYVALSFVRKPEDILHIKKIIQSKGKNTPVVAKIEKPEAVACMDAIVAVTDAVMVARGDLGVEMKTEEVPSIQKRLIKLCNKAGVPVITATQMLESMIQNPRPTRAEASDVANAILDGTDAVMLSAETASGKYPIEAITIMKKIIQLIEQEMPVDYSRRRRSGNETLPTQEGIAVVSCSLAELIDADAIVCITMSGATGRIVAKYRPHKPIIAITHSEKVLNQINLVWGLRGLLVPDLKSNIDESVLQIEKIILDRGYGKKGHTMVITAGLPFSGRGVTNSVRVEMLDYK